MTKDVDCEAEICRWSLLSHLPGNHTGKGVRKGMLEKNVVKKDVVSTETSAIPTWESDATMVLQGCPKLK